MSVSIVSARDRVPAWFTHHSPHMDSALNDSFDNGTPVARPVRKAKGLTFETAWPPKLEIGSTPTTFVIMEQYNETVCNGISGFRAGRMQ